MDLIDDIKKVDAMILLHSSPSSKFMLEQYQYKKAKLASYLIDELLKPEVRSPKSFAIIKVLLDKYYPNASKEAKGDIAHEDLEQIELALTA